MPFSFEPTLPAWMTFTAGEVPIVLVAPHGGRRPADAPIIDSIKVNDLYTAELTHDLAEHTRSYALINRSHDRNELDLNRVSQVKHEAPWFLRALVELLSALTAQHDSVRVFFIHGWNVVQPVCDVGIGLRQRAGKLLRAGKGEPTLEVSFFSDVMIPFCEAAQQQNIDVAIGRRYAAAAQNNFMQVFSARFLHDDSAQIRTLAELSVQGKINAAQLELGVGLRWPGQERDRFVHVFCHTLGNSVQNAAAPDRDRDFSVFSFNPPVRGGAEADETPYDSLLPWTWERAPTRLALHFHDPMSGLGVMGGVEFDPGASVHAGRLLLSLGGTEMVLFTGEDTSGLDRGHVQVGQCVWRRQPSGLSINYRGTIMRFAHPQAFIRLEDGLAASWIEPAEVDLHLVFPALSASRPALIQLCQLQGSVAFPDREYTVSAWGFVDVLRPDETDRLLPRRLLSLPFGSDLGIFLARSETPEGPRSSGIVYQNGRPHPLDPVDWQLEYAFTHGRPTQFSVAFSSSAPLSLECQGETLTAIPIVRHTHKGPALAVTFGLSRTVWQGREAYGIYEFSEYLKDASARTGSAGP